MQLGQNQCGVNLMHVASMIEENKKLLAKYPWFKLDEMPQGWIAAFGELMCEDIQQELEKFDYVDKYEIVQVKEKFATLTIYDNGVPEGCKVHDIIEDYSALSEFICIGCGELNVPCTIDSWIVPICKKCIRKMNYKNPEEKWDDFSKKQQPHMLPFYRVYRQWTPNKEKPEEISVDLSDKLDRIVKRYAERKENGEFAVQ